MTRVKTKEPKHIPNTRPEWAKKIPRSSRVCFRCGHKYSSHVPSCGKLIQRKPERIECTCRTFVKNQYELELAVRREAREDKEWEEAKVRREAEKAMKIQIDSHIHRR